ncbi:hypothetical protein J4409_00475 [Candidatus Woesearchaeota archaeon]|nr:hypothetical protein [Candidatus Woesearchaeota archaeon]
MVNKLLQPQEVEVFYIIPAIRRELALCMKLQGYKQKDIAKKLGTTEPAISYYLASKRATEVNFDKRIKDYIKYSAKKINDHKTLTAVLQDVLKRINKSRITCGICKKKISLEDNCNICFR